MTKFFAGKDRKRVWLSWAISYISVLLIPMIISAAVYVESSNIVQREITQSNQNLLRQVQLSIDRQLADIERLSLQIAWNSRLTTLFNNVEYTDYQRYNISLLVQDFRLYKVANSFVDDFFVHITKSQAVISPMSIYDSQFYVDNRQNTDRITLDQWNDLRQTTRIREYILLDVKDTAGTLRKNIAFVQSLPWEDPRQALATLVVVLDETRFFESINSIPLIDSGNVLVLNSKNQLVTARKPIEWDETAFFDELEMEDMLYDIQINGEAYVVSYASSSYQDWKYVYMTPTNVFMQKLSRLRAFMWLSLGFCLLIGGVVSYYFAKKHYAPVQNLVDLIAAKAGIKLERRHNEFRFIEESISETLSENERVQRYLQKQDHILQSNLIVQLLNGRNPKDLAPKTRGTGSGISFQSDTYTVALIYIEGYRELFKTDDSENPWEQLELVQFILRNVIEELLGRTHQAFLGELDGSMLACIVSASTESATPEEVNHDVVNALHEAKAFLKDKFSICLTMAVGGVHEGPGGIVQAYREALDAMEYRMLMGQGSLIEYKDLGATEPLYAYTLAQEHQMINHVKAGDYDAACTMVEAVYQENFGSRVINAQMAKCIMSDLVSSIIKAITEIGGDKEGFLESLAPIDRVLQADTVMDMKNRIMEVLQEVCACVNENRSCLHAGLQDEVVGFVRKHYMDPNLSVKMIGAEFHLTPAYLSRLFREHTGESLPDYINRYRIDQARELLKNPKNSISRVAERTGFSNSNSLIRTFKRHEGITPGQFKAMQTQ